MFIYLLDNFNFGGCGRGIGLLQQNNLTRFLFFLFFVLRLIAVVHLEVLDVSKDVDVGEDAEGDEKHRDKVHEVSQFVRIVY